jgi:NAD(P)-dependent dehydrogenase (short-subunit alcohol dehydrogenase family)
MVVEGSQAERAGLQRGDIICLAGTEGEEEIMYKMFIDMAASPQRPLVFDIRRVESSTGSSGGGGKSTSSTAEAFARKQAVIAAAEKREKARKALEKPTKKTYKPKTNAVDVNADLSNVPQSEEARRAMEAAKQGESQLSAQLGYNPYETKKATAGQARNATVGTKHGSVDAGSGGTAPIPKVAPPKEAMVVADDVPPVSDAFQQAFEECVTSSDHTVVVSSFGILRKLITNASTKDEDKFKRVRLANAKIRAAITEVHGALDIMMACGFLLTEQDGESVLVYPTSEGKGPAWLPRALQQMQLYENNGAPTSSV